MSRAFWYAVLTLAVLQAGAPSAQAQQVPYIGYVYPAGGRQGSIFQVTLGGQSQDNITRVYVSGVGVQARLIEYNKRLSNQEIGLLNEQRKDLRALSKERQVGAVSNLMTRLQKLIGGHVNQPASAALVNQTVAEVTIASGAAPGPREIRLGTPRGFSNPLVFMVGQLPEFTAPPAPVTQLAVLGKEGQSLRRKPRRGGAEGGDMMTMSAMMGSAGVPSDVDDEETRLEIPCTANGQITPGSVDRFRFTARKGQRLVLAVKARELIPYMADAVPGWFQPVLVLSDARGREVAYDDDYRFKPDPVILCEIPEDGEYRLAIHDAIFRGREDFVYRLSVGELPFVTSLFPLGCPAGAAATFEVKGWNLTETRVATATNDATPGVHTLVVRGRGGLLSDPVPYACDTLPECLEQEPNNDKRHAQRLAPPVIVNGRIAEPGDLDLFRFDGLAGDTLVAEVVARRLDSPLDATIKLTDAAGKLIAFNDDTEDAASGLNTHHADAYLRACLPTNGVYYLQIGDTQHNGGEACAYRLRISPPRADFALRVVPSSVMIRGKGSASLSVFAFRKDGFTGPIKLTLQNPPPGFEMDTAWLRGTQAMTRVNIKTTLGETPEPVNLTIVGAATNTLGPVVRTAVPAEDRMQAFLWRHLVPAQELTACVFIPPWQQKAEASKPPAPSVTPKPQAK